jgi:hypothetical protein
MSYIGTHVINGQYQCDNTDGGEFKMWMDHFVFSNGSVSGFNQGLYCVALKCAKALRQSISSQQITDAITQYQALYDTTNKLVRFASDKTHSGGDVLAGEALSLFLFGEKMLSKEAVHGTINAIRTSKTVGGGKVVFTNTGGYIPSTDFGVGHQYVQGDYQNGGSWFLYEYLAYYAGFFHGYPAARALITERINIELGSEPTSHEWLQTKSSLANYLSEPASHHVFCWNCAAYTMRITTRQNV